MSVNIKISFLVLLSYGFYHCAMAQEDFYDISKVQEVRITFRQSNWKHLLDSLILVDDGKNRLICDVTVNGQLIKNAGVRYKGFSSYDADYIKNPFSIYLDHTISDRNYQGYTTIKLSNVIHDPSFVREALAYEIARKYMPASRANFARLYINDTLIGLYSNVESVDEHFTEDHFGSHGNSFFKGSPVHLEYPFGNNSNLSNILGTDTSDYLLNYECESGHGWSDLYHLIDVLNNDTANLSGVLDIDRTLWMHALNYALVNLDSYIGYCQNYYLYMDDHLRFNPIPWDMNMSFGSFRHSDGTTLNLTIAKAKQADPLKQMYSATFSPRPLTRNLFLNNTCRKMYLAHMRTIMDENFGNQDYIFRASDMQALIDQDVQDDTNKFYSYSDFINNLNVTTGPTSYQYPGLTDFMEARMAYLDTFPGFRGAPEVFLLDYTPQQPARGEETWIIAGVSSASSVMLGYRTSSKDVFVRKQMSDDGNHHDGLAGDSIYGTSITADGSIIQYYIWAENDSTGVFAPQRAEYEYQSIQTRIDPGDMVINEFMAVNKSAARDQDGEYDPWLEIFNNTGEDLGLTDIYLSDDAHHPLKWRCPASLLKAKGYLIIWMDGDTLQPGLHASFSLSGSGGKVFLSDSGRIIDSVIYSEQTSAMTVGRYPNGIGSFEYMPPSFAMHNFIGSTANTDVVIYPNPTKDQMIIEIKNDSSPVSVEFINSHGQMVYGEQLDFAAGMMPVISRSFDVSRFCKGIYLARVNYSDETVCKKFVIY